ncbi:hypothetical protein EJ04DRAFT_520996 [Polyplosphaeria fusca]|uniref:Uncharacterized protein n=1 Tax=Polyplosphaeria fusca TaxID=682080 RepID=A0A9P4V4G2_9PLEO|nr:hypothetical protein EJ04DRAFT_520996 [Polyplosphaeria fusca]
MSGSRIMRQGAEKQRPREYDTDEDESRAQAAARMAIRSEAASSEQRGRKILVRPGTRWRRETGETEVKVRMGCEPSTASTIRRSRQAARLAGQWEMLAVRAQRAERVFCAQTLRLAPDASAVAGGSSTAWRREGSASGRECQLRSGEAPVSRGRRRVRGGSSGRERGL